MGRSGLSGQALQAALTGGPLLVRGRSVPGVCLWCVVFCVGVFGVVFTCLLCGFAVVFMCVYSLFLSFLLLFFVFCFCGLWLVYCLCFVFACYLPPGRCWSAWFAVGLPVVARGWSSGGVVAPTFLHVAYGWGRAWCVSIAPTRTVRDRVVFCGLVRVRGGACSSFDGVSPSFIWSRSLTIPCSSRA